jgi:salicylate hydroxylase
MEINTDVLVTGGGIGGLAAALALARVGAKVRVLERAAAFSEVGAGIQIGPNVTRILRDWGLEGGLRRVAAFPSRLQAREAMDGRVVGLLPLAGRAEALYGAPYATIHRADLHALLLAAVQQAGVDLQLGSLLAEVEQGPDGVTALSEQGEAWPAQALVGADGLWSRTRSALGLHGGTRFSGHLAYRALVAQDDLPPAMRSDQVTVWMGPRLHVVHYPVQAGRSLNLIVIVQGTIPPDPQSWDQAAQPARLWEALGPVCPELMHLLRAVPAWRLWALHDRLPLSHAAQMAHGRVALLGDAAHPMLPYLAQGAGMAIEDAHVLARCWALEGDVALRLQRYAGLRWARNARVQSRAIRNGRIFHARGLMAWGRDLSMTLLGEQIMDVPWLYQGPAV